MPLNEATVQQFKNWEPRCPKCYFGLRWHKKLGWYCARCDDLPLTTEERLLHKLVKGGSNNDPRRSKTDTANII